MKTANFKSVMMNYKKEYYDLKRNTCRVFSKEEESDIRKEMLDDWIAGRLTELQVQITNRDLPSEHCIKKVTDVTLWKGIYIISW